MSKLRAMFIRLQSIVMHRYRLAPEHPFPAGLDDCTEVTKYILNPKNAGKFNIDAKRVAISGDSAGRKLSSLHKYSLKDFSND